MERKFCGKCGKPIAECICQINAPKFGTTRFDAVSSEAEAANRAGDQYIKRFDNIALAQGEVVVRQYHIGEFARGLGVAGSGRASVIITNKRVISKQDSNTTGFSSTSVEEVNLENVQGVNNFYSQGLTIWRIALAAVGAIAGLVCFFGSFSYGFDFSKFLVSLFWFGFAGYMAVKSRKPSYLFSVYASTSTQALTTGVNLRGKLFNSAGYGLVFQYKPTQDAIRMMCEMGACIMDLKNKGDYAIEAWKQN